MFTIHVDIPAKGHDDDCVYRASLPCGHCGRSVESAASAWLELRLDQRKQPTREPLRMVHRHCVDAFEREHGGPERWRSFDGRELPRLLASALPDLTPKEF